MKKFLSRKLLVAVISLVSAVLAGVGLNPDTVDVVVPSVAGIAMSYMVAQGWIDGKEADAAKAATVKAPELRA